MLLVNAWLHEKAASGSEKELIRGLNACVNLGITLHDSVVSTLFTKAKERALTGVIRCLIESKALTNYKPAELARLAFKRKDLNLFKQCLAKLKDDAAAKKTLLEQVMANQSARKPYVVTLVKAGADMVEFHTGTYANAKTNQDIEDELNILRTSVEFASKSGLNVAAGHGLNYVNTPAICQIPQICELSIGHSIIARAIHTGIYDAVKDMIDIINNATLHRNTK